MFPAIRFTLAAVGAKKSPTQPLNRIFTDEEELLRTVEKTILFFREQGKTGERLADTIHRLGFDYVEKGDPVG